MIELHNVSVVFGAGTPMETCALDGFDLEIGTGEFTTVIGSNGAGKSTLLNVIAGDVAATSGSIRIQGIDVTRWSPPRRAWVVARVFQDPMAGTCDALTIEENFALAATRGRRRGLSRALKASNRARFREQLARLQMGLENRLQDRVGLLSGGQRQAVSLLMATFAETRILLLDEHTAALDPGISEFVLDLTRQLVAEQRLTALMVTHSMRQALDCGSRTIMLHEGHIAFEIEGAQRKGLDVPDLLALFTRARGQELADDSLVLS